MVFGLMRMLFFNLRKTLTPAHEPQLQKLKEEATTTSEMVADIHGIISVGIRYWHNYSPTAEYNNAGKAKAD